MFTMFHTTCFVYKQSIYNVTVAKGECPTAPPDFTPVVRQSVCYVVMAVILNDKKEVLMMQEAKKSCSGLWYLPAGRIEASESIVVCFPHGMA